MPPTSSAEVAPAEPDRVGHPATEPVDLHHHLLQPRTRRRNQADRPAVDRVGEGQRQPADRPGSTVGSHHEQSPFTGLQLECELILDAHVVAEDEGVDVPVQEPVHLRCHVLSGDGHEREVRVAGDAQAPARENGPSAPPIGSTPTPGARGTRPASRRGTHPPWRRSHRPRSRGPSRVRPPVRARPTRQREGSPCWPECPS